ncbi:MAG: hypothetical protein ABJN69_07225 [Hellea sp.]
MKDDEKMCPSSRCKPGALLIGMVKADSTVGHVPMRLEIDEDFVKSANADGKAETRFRFSSPCVEGKCAQWSGDKCGVVEKAADKLAATQTEDLPNCSIRKDCRWFKQRQAEACRVCSFVITDNEKSSEHYTESFA